MLINKIAMVHSVLLHDFSSFFNCFGFFEFFHKIAVFGGGTTEVAIVSAGGVVECESIKVAGSSFDSSISSFSKSSGSYPGNDISFHLAV